jgi:pimeloyl-ACP methyl ester carboxylesterase
MTKLVSVADVDVHIEGDGAETIFMVHGWPDTYRLWDAQVQFLKTRYRCVRFTLPGFDAAKARRAFSLDELTGFLKQVIERLCPGQKVVLMLHDWGCFFGYQFYMRNQQMVSKIIGVDIGDGSSLRKSITRLEKMMVMTYQVWLAAAWVIGGWLGDGMTRFMARRFRCPSDAVHISSCMTYPYFIYWFGGRRSYRRQAQRFLPSCPILFIYGRRKPFMFHAKAWAEGLLAGKANQVVEFDTGHWVMSEQPERFNQVVSSWLSNRISIERVSEPNAD